MNPEIRQMPVVSVVMSVLNGELFLSEAVESILAQSFTDFEFIIINDGSTDETATLLDRYQKSDFRVRVYHQQHNGLVESLNRGCAFAQGKYIARMDADDIALKDRLLSQVDFMEKHPDVVVLGGAVEFIDTEGEALGVVSTNPISDHQIRAALVSGCPFWHPTVLIRRDALHSVGGYRKKFIDAEDCDLWLRMADHAQLANLASVVLKYRCHPSQVSVRKCHQQALSTLAAHAVANARRRGESDPLEFATEITPDVLSAIGVSTHSQAAALAHRYLWGIRNMCETGQDSRAVELFSEMSRASVWKYAARRVISDLHLLAAGLYWRQGRIARSALAAAQAVLKRPVILARPVKRLIQRPVQAGTTGSFS
jgi:cellulose synthase/poly-beta-1,6-N-acetylglucosamine synthase-like glycosyltransferase